MKSLDEFIVLAKSKTLRKLVVAAAADKAVLEAVKIAMQEKMVVPILVGDKFKIQEICSEIDFDISKLEIIDEQDFYQASLKAVSIIKSGKAEILMKGLVPTSQLLKAVLNSKTGIRKAQVLSHVAIMQSPYYHKLFAITDAAMNISPTLDEKIAIINNAVDFFNNIGIQKPKLAVICPIETVNPKIESTVHAAELKKLNKAQKIKNCIIDGPLALDNAISKESAKHKGIVSEVAGDIDILLIPDLNTGNVLYKSLNFIGGAISAGIVVGAQVPIVLTSRADSIKSKVFSIALAATL